MKNVYCQLNALTTLRNLDVAPTKCVPRTGNVTVKMESFYNWPGFRPRDRKCR